MTYTLPLVVWLRLDRVPPGVIRDAVRARRLMDQGVPVRAYVPNGSSVAPPVAAAREGVPRPMTLGMPAEGVSAPANAPDAVA